MIIKKIKSIEFSFLSPEQIRKMGVVEIKTPETYDKDGYPMESGLMDPHLGVINPGLKCKTCGQRMKKCPGHFGTLELIRPVLHSEYGKRIEELLMTTCKDCGRILLPEDKIALLAPGKENRVVNVGKRILIKTKKIKKCPHCNAPKVLVSLDKPTTFSIGKERLYPNQIREWVEKIPNKDLAYYGYHTDKLRPEWFVLTVLPVPPITIRPSITLENGIRSEDDLTHKIVDIIRINSRLKDNIDAGAPQLIIEDLWDLLQFHVTTYFNNDTAGVPPAKYKTGRPLRTIAQRLQGKKGRFRHNLIGKRVNFAARTTITPDTWISINELGIPQQIANELTIPEGVTEWNLKEVQEKIKKGEIVYVMRPNGVRKKVSEENRQEIVDEIGAGFKVERTMRDGDVVVFNRQPSLHRLSMMAHIAKIMPGKTFRLNPAVAQPYNADFDGDEMNMHLPQTEEGKAEARTLMLVKNQIISPRYGAPVITFQQDEVSSMYILSLKSTVFSKQETMEYLYEAGITDIPTPDMPENKYSGKLILSQLLPKDFDLELKTTTCNVIRKAGLCKECVKDKCPYDAYLIIENGKIKCGVIDKASLGEGTGRLIDKLARKYPTDVISNFYDAANRIGMKFISRTGMTIGLDEYEITDKIKKVKEEAIAELIEEGDKIVKQYRAGKLELIPGKNMHESFETKMLVVGIKSKRKLEEHLVAEKLNEVLKEKPKFNSTIIIVSGARGNASNLTNIIGLWGQAAVRGKRPTRGFKDRAIALNEKGDESVTTGGFVTQSFMEGLSPREFFYHSMGGRQGEVDTGVATKVSGYLYRRFANALKDLLVTNDRSVRTASNSLVQIVYGEDGIFPQYSLSGKAMSVKGELNELLKERKKKSSEK